MSLEAEVQLFILPRDKVGSNFPDDGTPIGQLRFFRECTALGDWQMGDPASKGDVGARAAVPTYRRLALFPSMWLLFASADPYFKWNKNKSGCH